VVGRPTGETATLLQDDFNGPTGPINSSVWDFNHFEAGGSFYGRTQQRQMLPTMSNGVVHLQLDTFNPTNRPDNPAFLGSEAISKQLFTTTNGGIAFEVSARLVDSVGGIVGGFFSYNFNTTTQLHDEIDFETLGNEVKSGSNREQTNIYGSEPLGPGHTQFTPIAGSLTDFHTYRIEWFPDRVRWLIDNQLVRESFDHVPQNPMALHLNIWVPDSNWAEAFDPSLQPALKAADNKSYFFDVDYVHVAQLQPTIFGTEGNDNIVGTNLNEWIDARGGDDTINGGAGFDTAIFAGLRSAYTLTNLGNGNFQVSGPEGVDTLSNVERLVFDDQTLTALPTLAPPTFELAAFGPNAGGWSSDNTYPRLLADVNNDHMADIVGFGNGGVWVALATGGGHFAQPTFQLAAFGPNAGGWSSDDTYPRLLADVNNDQMADIVGFGNNGVWVSLATGGGHFAQPTFELAAFGPNAGGWSSDNSYPREVADVNGDHMADIVGFGNGGVWVALATGGGHFAQPTFELAAFGLNAGGWSSDDTYPRLLADVNNDQMADIVGFGNAGVWVALATGGGHFAQPAFELSAFALNAGGWSSENTHPRMLADMNGDKLADIVGFGNTGVWVAPATGGGHFAQPTFELSAFGPNAGGWTSQDTYPRMAADVTGDHVADIVGFGNAGVWAALSQDWHIFG
jgi:Glycosyl hydrolases family 16/FG-GAP-like repeat